MISDMPRSLELTLKSLKANHFDARLAQTADEAREMVLEMIPLTARVGIGDSVTLRQIGVIEELAQRGNEVINPFAPELTQAVKKNPAMRKLLSETSRKTFGTDVFATSVNAVTEDGKLVSIDRVGNRVAGTVYAAPKVILVTGRNKIVKNADAAIDHIKNVIAPAHATQKQYKTPCTVTGECTDCDSPDRLCNVTIIIEKKPLHTDISVILVNEDLGLGWNPAWDEKRIDKIRSDYYQHSVPF